MRTRASSRGRGPRRAVDLFLFLCAFSLAPGVAMGAQQTWVWARQAGSAQNFENAWSASADAAGNVCIAGFVQGNAFSTPGFGF